MDLMRRCRSPQLSHRDIRLFQKPYPFKATKTTPAARQRSLRPPTTRATAAMKPIADVHLFHFDRPSVQFRKVLMVVLFYVPFL